MHVLRIAVDDRRPRWDDGVAWHTLEARRVLGLLLGSCSGWCSIRARGAWVIGAVVGVGIGAYLDRTRGRQGW